MPRKKADDTHLIIAEKLAILLDNQFELFGIRFGLDPILGLIPGGGDTLSAVVGGYIIWVGWRMGLPSDKVIQMLFNLVLDLILGVIPLFGDVLDFVYKSNEKNIKIVKEHLRSVRNEDEAEEGVIVE